MTRVVKLTRIDGEPVYLRADLVSSIDASTSSKDRTCVVCGSWNHVVTESIDDVARLVWPDLDKPAAPVVSDEDVEALREIRAWLCDGGDLSYSRAISALDSILIALGR